MSRLNNHFKWCLKDERRLKKIKPNINLAKKHFEKSEYNYKVVLKLEELKIYDWALNIGFYSIYHCFLAILSKYGYETKNQSCTITVILNLIEHNKLDLDKNLVLKFDTFEVGNEMTSSTVRTQRELSTYGVKTSIDLEKLKEIKEIIIQIQRETIKILEV
jgi:uncharacterized protein (UPF0332 family)